MNAGVDSSTSASAGGVIRLATLDDLPAIVAIYNQAIPGRTATADLDPVTVDDRREWFDRHDAATHPLYVLDQAERVVSWQSFERFHTRAAYRATAEISLYVASDCQGCGIGRRMVEHALLRAAELPYEILVALIFGHNHRSLRLFRNFGFSDWGHLPGVARLDDQPRDLMILGRRVQPADH